MRRLKQTKKKKRDRTIPAIMYMVDGGVAMVNRRRRQVLVVDDLRINGKERGVLGIDLAVMDNSYVSNGSVDTCLGRHRTSSEIALGCEKEQGQGMRRFPRDIGLT